MMIPLGEWAPDQPSNASGLLTAENTIPGPNGYRPVKAFVADYAAGPAAFKGAGEFTAPSGIVKIIGGTATNLYHLVAGVWTSLGAFATTARWRFAQFGELVIATNGTSPLQKYDLTTGALAVLGGSPPTFKLLAAVKDFFVGAVMNGKANEMGWCAINNVEDWGFGQNQSDYQIMPFGGDINGLFGGEVGLILQRNRITRMDYVGGNEIFIINEISNNLGCVAPYSAVQHGVMGFFLSDDGFMQWDGAQLRPIGNEKVDRYFFSTYGRANWNSMSAAIDAENQVAMWSMGDRIFCYHWPSTRWTLINQAAQIIFSGFVPDGEGLGGDDALYVINSSNVLGRFSGANMAPTWVMPDFELAKGREAHVSVIRPETDAVAGLTLSVAARARLGDAIAFTDYTDLRTSGTMPVRERGRYCRVKMVIAAGSVWSYVQGVDPMVSRGARR